MAMGWFGDNLLSEPNIPHRCWRTRWFSLIRQRPRVHGTRAGLPGHGQRRLLRAPLPQLGARAERALQRPAPTVLPKVHAARPDHRRAGSAGRLQNQQQAPQVPRLQNTHRSLAKRLRFWRNLCFTERCTSRLNVGVSLSICLLVIALFFVQGEEENYAYVDHEGGYTALGYIDSQEVYVYAELIGSEGETMASGMSRVRRTLQDAPIDNTFVEGVQLNAAAGLRWYASERNHKLSIYKLELESDGSPNLPSDWLNMLEELEANNLANYESHAKSALRYEKPPPRENSIVSEIGELLSRWLD